MNKYPPHKAGDFFRCRRINIIITIFLIVFNIFPK